MNTAIKNGKNTKQLKFILAQGLPFFYILLK